MAAIQPANSHDFERVYPLIQQFDNPLVGKEDWRTFFSHHWVTDDLPVGYIIEDNAEVVGFLGTIFSRRSIGDKEYLFCNLSTWIVQEDHRGMSLLLLFEVLKRKECTFTDFTANKVAPILKKFSFQDLAQNLFVQFPLPFPQSLFGGIKVYTQENELTGRLEGLALSIYQDHAGLKCSHLLVETGQQQCYLLYDVVQRKRLPFARIHYISNPQFYLNQAYRFASPACRKAKVYGWMAAENLLRSQKPRFAYTIPQKQSLLFKSDSLSAQQVDTLYSELQLLGLRT
jgi:acetoacetyl-CoA synthetase